jgi:hypothetical protein
MSTITWTETVLLEWNTGIVRGIIAEPFILFLALAALNIYEAMHPDSNWLSNDEPPNRDALPDQPKAKLGTPSQKYKVSDQDAPAYPIQLQAHFDSSQPNPDEPFYALKHPQPLTPLDDPLAGKFVIGGDTPPDSPKHGAQPTQQHQPSYSCSGDRKPNPKVVPNFLPSHPLEGKLHWKKSQDLDQSKVMSCVHQENPMDMSNLEMLKPKMKEDRLEVISGITEKMSLNEEVMYHLMYHLISLGYCLITWPGWWVLAVAWLHFLVLVGYVVCRILDKRSASKFYYGLFPCNSTLLLTAICNWNSSEA